MSEATREETALDEIRTAMHDPNVSLRTPYIFGQGIGVQVYIKSRKIGPVIIPNRDSGQTVADVLHMLGEMAES